MHKTVSADIVFDRDKQRRIIMDKNKGLESALRLLPQDICAEIRALPGKTLEQLNEIRLRSCRNVVLTVGRSFLELGITAETEDIHTAAVRAFRNSLHTSTEQLCSGYVTYDNGCRVGFAGTACAENGSVVNIKHINSVCIRIPREVTGCGSEIFDRYLSERPVSLLICGAPSSGKTTCLRDIARLCGGRYRTALIDERGEIASVSSGNACCDIGLMTDVFDRYPRKAAVETAVRVMSPQIIICDEIGSEDDIASLSYAVCSGVKLTATCHSGSIDELFRKPNISRLLENEVFDVLVYLENGRMVQTMEILSKQCSKL